MNLEIVFEEFSKLGRSYPTIRITSIETILDLSFESGLVTLASKLGRFEVASWLNIIG